MPTDCHHFAWCQSGGNHGGDPDSVFRSESGECDAICRSIPRRNFCHKVGLTYVSGSPFRVPVARLALTADEIAPTAEFFNCGTKDLNRPAGRSAANPAAMPTSCLGASAENATPSAVQFRVATSATRPATSRRNGVSAERR
jgi:hypothetical protein